MGSFLVNSFHYSFPFLHSFLPSFPIPSIIPFIIHSSHGYKWWEEKGAGHACVCFLLPCMYAMLPCFLPFSLPTLPGHLIYYHLGIRAWRGFWIKGRNGGTDLEPHNLPHAFLLLACLPFLHSHKAASLSQAGPLPERRQAPHPCRLCCAMYMPVWAFPLACLHTAQFPDSFSNR